MLMRRGLIALALGFSFFIHMPAAQAQYMGQVGQMFDSFTVSLVAASRCDQPDERTMSRFMGNLMIVQDAILGEYRKRYPRADEATLLGVIDRRINQLGGNVEKAIAQRGCMDASIIRLVRLFELNARPDLFQPDQAGSK